VVTGHPLVTSDPTGEFPGAIKPAARDIAAMTTSPAQLTSVEARPLSRDESRAVFGQVMGLVAVTLGFLALGAYIGRDLSGGLGILFFIASFGLTFGINAASARGNQQLAMTLLFGLGLALGLALGPVINSYAQADPSAIWQSAGATAGFVGVLGAAGYATRRDLSPYYRLAFWALLGLLAFGIVAIFVSIPSENVIWAVAGLVIFGGYTVLDFNRVRRAGQDEAAPIAASIFLDVLNIFLFFLQLFGGENE
jgi:FtsH-binding integral membrane protein